MKATYTIGTLLLFLSLVIFDGCLFMDSKTSTNSYSVELQDSAIEPHFIHVQANAILSGCYVGSSQLMNDDLRYKGLLPMVCPNDELLYASPGLFSNAGPSAIVDWVELRLKSIDTLITYQCLITRCGKLVDCNGDAELLIEAPNGYYIAQIKHRNHLAIQTLEAIYLSDSIKLIDFTNPSLKMYNDSIAARVIGGKRCLYGGNALADAQLNYEGANSDRASILNASNSAGYFNADVNLNGTVDFFAPNSADKNLLMVNLSNNTKKIISQQTTF